MDSNFLFRFWLAPRLGNKLARPPVGGGGGGRRRRQFGTAAAARCKSRIPPKNNYLIGRAHVPSWRASGPARAPGLVAGPARPPTDARTSGALAARLTLGPAELDKRNRAPADQARAGQIAITHLHVSPSLVIVAPRLSGRARAHEIDISRAG